jgi:hypothetical protein
MSWISEQVKNPDQSLKDYADKITLGKDYDETCLNVLRQVIKDLRYTPDQTAWGMSEYWQTGKETLSKLTGDCEDGATLIYLLCRYKGVPANHLLLLCGDVEGGGHCFLGYKPETYPLNFVFLDWCYWQTNNNIEDRSKFYINHNKIKEYNNLGSLINSKYYDIWFAFNEETSIKDYFFDLTKIKNYSME